MDNSDPLNQKPDLHRQQQSFARWQHIVFEVIAVAVVVLSYLLLTHFGIF